MKKILGTMLTIALASTAFGTAEAKGLFDDGASFTIAKSVKLGFDDGGTTKPTGMSGGKGLSASDCLSNVECPNTQKCENGRCVDVCTGGSCTDSERPTCVAKNHAAVCECTEDSCGDGRSCVDGKCVSCSKDDPCGCPGAKVSDGKGGCYCAGESSCSAGKRYEEDLCSCSPCDAGEKCGCEGNSVSDGFGGCECTTAITCAAGNYQSKTSCTCEPCKAGDNESCETPCPAGEVPDGEGGCGAYACSTDADCDAGKLCDKAGTFEASCVNCEKNTPCTCPDGQLADGEGGCKTVECQSDADCAEGSTCQDAGTVDAVCVFCEKDAACNCPEGKVSDGNGNCVTPACTDNSDCPAAQKCVNAGQSDAVCMDCDEDDPTCCPTGTVPDGKGNCVPGCAFATAAECVSGTDHCTACSKSGKCNTCTACETGYYADSGECKACSDHCKDCSGRNSCTVCEDGYKLSGGKCVRKTCAEMGYKDSCQAGESATKTGFDECVSCSPIDGYCSLDGECDDTEECVEHACKPVSCGACQKAENHKCTDIPNCCTGNAQCDNDKQCVNNECVDLDCGNCTSPMNHQCVATPNCCTADSDCGTDQTCDGGECTLKTCAQINSTYKTECGADETATPTGKTGRDGACYTCKTVEKCPAGYDTAVTACDKGYDFKTEGSVGGKLCGKCDVKACASGYSTDVTSCGGGYELKTAGFSAGKPCGKCEAVACPDGYSTSVTSCTGKEKLETSGSSGGKACGKCVSKETTCAESNYYDSLGPWTSNCATNGGTPKSTKIASGRTCYYCGKGNTCSSMDSRFFEENSKTCPSGETAVYTGQSANGKKCYWCKASCSKWGYFAKGKGNCSSTQKEVETTQTGTEGKCYTCAKKTCEDYGLTSDPSKSPQPNFVATTINDQKCYCLNCDKQPSGGTGGSSCSQCSPSPDGTYTSGFIRFFGSTFAKNAWQHGHCCDNVSKTTVASGHKCVIRDGILVGGSCPRNN